MKESWASSPGRRKNMQANRSRDTQPELAVRRLLHADGFRYRVHVQPVSGLRRRADLVFSRVKMAVFIDGCFWHCCPEHSHQMSINQEYWSTKLARNRERDRETNIALQARGWLALRFWEHEDPEKVANTIKNVYRRLRSEGG
ncbi:very short patch repair endonuclease [Micromonospora chalcea]|uniref:very short patch repair endonuclease n=1 Tax=Micromonospora chalcea TaxID=1874 RepID=UPI00332DAA8A